MAKITLDKIKHSYQPHPQQASDYALQELQISWQDGGAYALLGPSGCGKTTLLNIISGLIQPSFGKILFDDQDITKLDTSHRNIAQVFQFPVIYDTMSVYDNLAFPLKNRGLNKTDIKHRVTDIAQLLELSPILHKRASGLAADIKQKISLGRGLVRQKINVIMFDEPLTVIDPSLKWQLRSKLKQLHRQISSTMIYVTHDQTEALTFADKVVVMDNGQVLQIGTPVELFEHPAHVFVGHFIGSPGMNILPAELQKGQVFFNQHKIAVSNNIKNVKDGAYQLGIRPEFVAISSAGGTANSALPATVSNNYHLGNHQVLDLLIGSHSLKMIVSSSDLKVGQQIAVKFDPTYSHLYDDNGWLLGAAETKNL